MKAYIWMPDLVKEDKILFTMWRVDLVGVGTLAMGRTVENMSQDESSECHW